MKLSKVFIYLLFLSVFAVSDVAAEGLFGAHEFYLKNGMRVIVAPNHRIPIIKHMVWYKTGSASENVGKGGIAHLLEHLMFRGTKKVTGNKINRYFEENGMESNAFTGHDMTAYHQLADISKLELAMFLEADRMQNLQIKEDDFLREREIVFEERKQRIDNNPIARFAEVLNRTLWQEHPYGRPVTGTDKEIISLTKEDAETFYNNFYAPNNAILILAGDIDVETAKILANKYYGNIERKEVPQIYQSELKSGFKANINIKDNEIETLRLVKVYVAPSFSKNNKDVYPLQILAKYMGGGKTSKLYKKLVVRDKKALSVAVNYNPIAQSYGSFQISLIPVDGIDGEELISAFEKAWQEALNELNTDEVENVKQKMLAGLVYLKDNPEDAAYVIGAMATAGVSLEEIESQEQKLKQIRKQQVAEAAKRLINDAPQVWGILYPAEVKK
ncbi:MAG: insulinase family protein [Alphaproteobacteria bacterium]|nr:insulinase family protein [Alphaproteobacteria bacterium]